MDFKDLAEKGPLQCILQYLLNENDKRNLRFAGYLLRVVFKSKRSARSSELEAPASKRPKSTTTTSITLDMHAMSLSCQQAMGLVRHWNAHFNVRVSTVSVSVTSPKEMAQLREFSEETETAVMIESVDNKTEAEETSWFDDTLLRTLFNWCWLVALNCSYTSVQDLSPLIRCPLVYLYIDETDVTDLTPLSKEPLCHSLVRLDLSNTRVSDLSPLRGCCDLKGLELDFCPNLRTLQGMPPGIKDLSLGGWRYGIGQLASICSGLIELDISNCPQLCDLSGLQGLKALQRVYMSAGTTKGGLKIPSYLHFDTIFH